MISYSHSKERGFIMKKKLFCWLGMFFVSCLVFVGIGLNANAADIFYQENTPEYSNPSASLKAQSRSNYYQNTPAHTNPDGKINLTIYNQSQLNELSAIAGGDDQYLGNTGLRLAATDHIYAMKKGVPYPNVVGDDGVYQLYNESEFMSDQQVQFAAEFWNKVAGKKIVEIVANREDSDQVIYDSEWTGGGEQVPLGGQTFHSGIQFYPSNWVVEAFTETQLDQQKVATLIHEIGHGLAIPHLGGGEDGVNAPNNNFFGNEVMSTWSPIVNTEGIISTKELAASLALAGLSYQKPQRLAQWILPNKSYNVTYLPSKEITSTIPFGVEIYFSGNYLNQKLTANATGKINKNYDVYIVDDSIIEREELGISTRVGTTNSFGMTGQTVKITDRYTSNFENLAYYRFEFEGNSYVIDSSAFETKLDYLGMLMDAPNNYLNYCEPTSEVITITRNYNMTSFEDVTLEKTFIDEGRMVGTTLGEGFMGKQFQASYFYRSNNGFTYYGFYHDGNYYVVNASATH